MVAGGAAFGVPGPAGDDPAEAPGAAGRRSMMGEVR